MLLFFVFARLVIIGKAVLILFRTIIKTNADYFMQVSETKITHIYNQEDIQQILQLAIARQANDGEFSREQLLEIAAELDISPECLQLAEQDWQIKQGEIVKRQDFNIYRRKKLQKNAGNYVIVNSFLVLLNLINTGSLSWSLYVLLFWGLGLGLKAWNTYNTDNEEYEKAFQLWSRNQQLRQSIKGFVAKLLKY